MWKISLLIFCATNCVLAVQRFDTQPHDEEVNPTDEVILPCTIFGKSSKAECRWQKDGQAIGIHDNKYEFAGRHKDGDCSLRIFDADIKYDDGKIH